MTKNTSTVLIYVSFFTLIGFSVWATSSGSSLWALLLTEYVPKLIKDSDK